MACSGFRDEKQLWKFQKPRLVGRWDRYELQTPSGHPDVKGSFARKIRYIENKIGAPSIKALEPSQIDYCDWLVACGEEVWVCFGARKEHRVLFLKYEDLPNLEPSIPEFWQPRERDTLTA